MKNKMIIILVIILALLLFFVYVKNDGLYALSKINTTEIELINKYAAYKVKFPDDTIVESFVMEDDIESYFFSHNEYIDAVLCVPNDLIDDIFPEHIREYNKECIMDLSNGTESDKIQFGVWLPRTVVKWFSKTDRAIFYTVMQPDNESTRVYVSVDKLGWNLYKN